MDALLAGAQFRFAVAALLFIAVFDDIFFFGRGGFDSHLESLTFYFAHICLLTAIVNKKTCLTFLLGDCLEICPDLFYLMSTFIRPILLCPSQSRDWESNLLSPKSLDASLYNILYVWP